jgi:hypothetical protein
MSYSKVNRIGLATTVALMFAIAVVQGCSSSGDDQAAPSGGTGGQSSGGTAGTSTGSGGKGGKGGGGSGGAAGGTTVAEGGAAGDTGVAATCEPAQDHGEAAYLAAHGNMLPAL